MRRIKAGFAVTVVLASACAHEVRGDLITVLPITGINLPIPSITLTLPTPQGPMPFNTGPITTSLQSGMPSAASFDVTTMTVSTDQFLQFTFPLLSVVGGPAPTLEFQETGPVRVGINDATGAVEVLGNLRGGGTFDNNGSLFSSALMFVNDATNIFAPNNPPLPGITPPPSGSIPFPPSSLPDPRQLDPGFRPATTAEIQALLATQTIVISSYSISGIFRSPTQPMDISFSAMGQLGAAPEPSSVALLGTGLLGLLGYGWWHRRRSHA